MINAFRLAGFFTAHAIWCVSDGEDLIPMLCYVTDSGEYQMERLIINDDLEASVDFGARRLETNESDADDAALLFDGLITLEEGKIDAVIIRLRTYFSPRSQATLAVPYTSPKSGKFRVHKPKLLQWENCEDFDLSSALKKFFEGVAAHESGAKIWDDNLDESK